MNTVKKDRRIHFFIGHLGVGITVSSDWKWSDITRNGSQITHFISLGITTSSKAHAEKYGEVRRALRFIVGPVAFFFGWL